MKNSFIKVSVVIIALCLFSACGLSEKGIAQDKSLKTNRPFQERKFDAAAWRAGDAQTRGEMSKDLRAKHYDPAGFVLDNKNRAQVLEVLGEPDRKTRGRCCGARDTSEKEVWLYDLKVKTGGEKSETEQLQLYFTESGVIDVLRIAVWDDQKPDYFPRVG